MSKLARTLVKKDFWNFGPSTQKNWRSYKKMLSKMKKIKVVANCVKWQENSVGSDFWNFGPPTPKNWRSNKKKFGKKWKNNVVPNCVKICQKWFLNLPLPPHKKNIGGWKNDKQINNMNFLAGCKAKGFTSFNSSGRSHMLTSQMTSHDWGSLAISLRITTSSWINNMIIY